MNAVQDFDITTRSHHHTLRSGGSRHPASGLWLRFRLGNHSSIIRAAAAGLLHWLFAWAAGSTYQIAISAQAKGLASSDPAIFAHALPGFSSCFHCCEKVRRVETTPARAAAWTLFRSPCAILRVCLTGHFACNIVLLLPIDSLKCQTAASSVLLAAGLSDRFASAGGKLQGELNSNEKCFYWQPEFRHE